MFFYARCETLVGSDFSTVDQCVYMVPAEGHSHGNLPYDVGQARDFTHISLEYM